MSTTFIQPYLFFGGRCEEALAYYGTVLGAKVDMLVRYSDSPEPHAPGSIPAGFEDKVMHSSFHIGESTILASDGNEEGPHFNGVSLSVNLPNEEEARKAFDGLADGGEVMMPLGKTFWSPCFGMLTDKFGLDWMISVAPRDVDSTNAAPGGA